MGRSKANNPCFSNTQAPSSTDPATKNARPNRTPAPFLHAAPPSARHGNAGIPVLATPKPHRGIEEGLSGSKICLITQENTHSRVLGGLLCIARGPKSKNCRRQKIAPVVRGGVTRGREARDVREETTSQKDMTSRAQAQKQPKAGPKTGTATTGREASLQSED